MTPEQKFQQLFEEMYELCEENGWGDPFSYARSREIHMAGILEHTVAEKYSGADAYDQDGPCEYKSTIGKNIKATYNGISVQDTWEEQIQYIQDEKIGKYTNHYYARYENGKIQEIWRMDALDVIAILLPNLKKQYESTKTKKDPRLGYTIPTKMIKQFGIRVL